MLGKLLGKMKEGSGQAEWLGISSQADSPAVTRHRREAPDDTGFRAKQVDDANCRQNDGVWGNRMIFRRKII